MDTIKPAGMDAGRAASQPAHHAVGALVYVALALLALLPGLMLKYEIVPKIPGVGTWFEWLSLTLADIRFGSGVRFWLGVTGAGLMICLVLYPLRKLIARRKTLGSVSRWFHIHMLFGLGGPVLVLYHCNFSLGGFNANVALWAMIVVAVSGVLGYLVYANVSAEFYFRKQKARDELAAIEAKLVDLDALHTPRWALIDALNETEVDLLTPRKGVLASLRARADVDRRLKDLWKRTLMHVDQCAAELHLAGREHERIKREVMHHFRAYARLARQASARSVREQVWARWRLFHLPLFLTMTVAVALHVMAVWGMDGPADAPQPAPAAGKQVAQSSSIGDLLRASETSGAASGTRAGSSPPPPAKVASPARPAAAEPPQAAAGAAEPSAPLPDGFKTAPVRTVTVPVNPAGSPSPALPQVAASPPPVAPQPPPPAKTARADPPPPPAPPASTPPTPAPDTAQATLSGNQRTDVLRKVEQIAQPPMALGAGKVGGDTLTAQIASFKEKRARKEFAHSAAETGFELTGKHLKVDCAGCHKTPLKEQRSDNPRQCIDCHKKDDAHKGRRPDCAKCHTTNRWSQILKRQ